MSFDSGFIAFFWISCQQGVRANFTGIDDPYEEPFKPEIHLHSDQQSLEEEVNQILSVLRERGIIQQ